MTEPAARVQRTYLLLTLLSTLAASLIWGVNTLFLLDAGLNNVEAFTANAFFTAGMVIFEVPTGLVADFWGRRASYLLGAATLLLSTLLYLGMWSLRAPLWGWAIASAFIGLGFTFFSGAVEAWLVDALRFSGYRGELEAVFAKGQAVAGAAMLVGSFAGGLLAQLTNLGAPYLARASLLAITWVVAALAMKDLGFTPAPRTRTPLRELSVMTRAALDHGWRVPPVRWLMLAAPFSGGVAIYGFYALQPYLLELYGDRTAFGVAGLSAMIVAGAQIAGGVVAPFARRLFTRRTHVLIAASALSMGCLALLGSTSRFWVALVAVAAWGVGAFLEMPIRQAYLNEIVPSAQRATMLSFVNLMSSVGGVVVQPALGQVADTAGYAPSYLAGAAIELCALPFLLLARRSRSSADTFERARG